MNIKKYSRLTPTFFKIHIRKEHFTMSKYKKTVFTGVATALITPFRNGEVDYETLGSLIEYQISNGIDAIVAAGTTGEASTLTDEEHIEVIRYTVEKVNGRIPVIAGTGSNDTAYGIELSRQACEAGADALLVVTPYYNKATPKGLIKSFTATADAVNKPIILYNVPSRTGCNITLPVYKELAKHENIVAAKEASGNLSAVAQLAAECGDYLDIYSGNDDQITPVLSLGGKGVISVFSNIMPAKAHEMCRAWFDGDTARSTQIQLEYLKLMNSLFMEVNPVPVKTACAMLGMCSDEMRLPLCEMEEQNRARLESILREYSLLK